MQKKVGTSIFHKIKIALSVIFFLAAAFILVNVIIARIKNDTPRILGYSFHLVVTDSMTPEINVGDLVIARNVDKSEVQVDDDIVFVSKDPRLGGKTIIHRVTKILPNGDFMTSGIKAGAEPDIFPVSETEGVFVAKSVFLGKVFVFFSKPQNCIFVVVLMVLLYVTYKLLIRIVRIANGKNITETENENENEDKE